MKLLRVFDDLLNRITMYRLTLYGLAGLVGITIIMSILNMLPYASTILLVTLGIVSFTCFITNQLFSRLWHIAANFESSAITAFILYLILPPIDSVGAAATAGLAAVAAIAGKYLLVARGRHIFNPAAFGLAVVTVSGLASSRWWVGSAVLLPFTLALGLVIVRKLRGFTIVAVFFGVALVTILAVNAGNGLTTGELLAAAFTSWPLIFMGSIMLTEPSTLPARQHQRLINAAIVGLIVASQTAWGPLRSTPEIALLAGNLYALAVTPASRLRLTLLRITKLGRNLYDLEFKPDRTPVYQAGQYAELTLPAPLNGGDSRGNRRSFSLASAPNESTVRFGVKAYEPSSAFKRQLLALRPGAQVIANHIRGDFILPADPARKLALVAGGIGITPFRSQLAGLLADADRAGSGNARRDIVLIYLVSHPDELAYNELLKEAEDKLGLKVVRVLSSPQPAGADGSTRSTPPASSAAWPGEHGSFSTELVRRHIPDFAERLFYVSGPNRMVDTCRHVLRQLGVRRAQLRTDYFSGY